ncbi:hypothetical protein Ccr5_gp182c [Caulobacter phage Ccr5]|nr:hypothetical protein Ccr5_gp182c [Caulobacter phage Ccr5]
MIPPSFVFALLSRQNPDAWRWRWKFDAKYRRIPLHRRFGGYMPTRVQAKDMITFIGHRRLERRTLEKDRHAPAPR